MGTVTEEELYKERLGLALEASGLDMWENDLATGEVTRCVSHIFTELGYAPSDGLTRMDDLFALVHPEDVAGVTDAIARHIAGETQRYQSECRMRAKSGEWLWYANYGRIMQLGEARDDTRFIGVTFNIDERKRQEEETGLLNRRLAEQNDELKRMNESLQLLATTDALTGLANRRVLIDTGARECARLARFAQPLSLLMIDLDHFKQVNDAWGHAVGDNALVAVADLCRHRFRKGTDVVARVGGEEFAILMPVTPYADAMRVADELRMALAERAVNAGEGNTIFCTASIGVASIWPQSIERQEAETFSFDRLMVAADRALYTAKRAGRNQTRGHEIEYPLAD